MEKQEKKNVYEKLQICRCELQKKALKKSGKNSYSKYEYFELADFIPSVNELFREYGLFSNFSIKKDAGEAYLEIINTEDPTDKVVFVSPVAEADVKGCSAIQNLGGVHTYLRRYLYLNALEIVESDMFDQDGKEEPKKPAQKPVQKATPEQKPVQKATPEQVKQIKELNLNEEAMLKHYGIEKIEDLTIVQASEIISKRGNK